MASTKRQTSPSISAGRRQARARQRRTTLVGMALLVGALPLVLGYAGSSWQEPGFVLLVVGGALIMIDNTGTLVQRRRAHAGPGRSASSRHRASGPSRERWLAPIDVIDLRGKPHVAPPSPAAPPLVHPRVSPRVPEGMRRRRPGPR